MQTRENIQALDKLLGRSEYFLQVTLDESGTILASSTGMEPVTSSFNRRENPLRFGDCFLVSDWPKYEAKRLHAWNNKRGSFMVDLQKINHAGDSATLSRWEFFFVSHDFGVCHGVGHPEDPLHNFDFGSREFFQDSNSSKELLDTILESKLLGFWELAVESTTDFMSNGLAQVLGYQLNDFKSPVKISWRNHIHAEDSAKISQKLTRHFASRGREIFHEEFRINTKNDITLWVIGFGKTIRWDDAERPIKIQGLFLNITEKKKQELLMREYHSFLRDLAFQQSHSLRARVANILGILQILDTENQAPESRKLLEILKDESKMLDESLKKSIKESVLQDETLERESKLK